MESADWNAAITQYLKLGANPDASLGALLGQLGSACQAAVERSIGRTFDTRSYTETYDGNDRRMLFLRHDPVVSLTSVQIYGSVPLNLLAPSTPTMAAAVAIIDPTAQAILLTDGSTFLGGNQNVLVTYMAGLSDATTGQPPDDLIFAVTYWAAHLFKLRDRIGWKSQTSGDGQMVSFDQNIPVDVDMMIARWRKVMFA